ncbi:transmembrane protein 234 homolog isoform X1 [Hibiscus syriacus]|uniref:transmembrane protein 234 homolog isoform X1 n=1 Tax=Hibiscus syriacus TaxID=106335 RepID=UPI001920E053|nr:transmembrane protein 234 homolog isoform X1 [Hibiscus syriacus]
MIGDVEKMLAVGLIWGATNAAMRRGALLWDQYLKSTPASGVPPRKLDQRILKSLSDWLTLLLFWQYSIPFLINLSASATFFSILSQAPISLAVPVTNATTFAATAVFGILLGERTRIGLALLGRKMTLGALLKAIEGDVYNAFYS